MIHPSVTYHKGGKYLVIKPNDTQALDVLREVTERRLVRDMRDLAFYGLETSTPTMSANKLECGRVELWPYLKQGFAEHPLTKVLESYGIHVYIAPTLSNWAKKEARRQEIEGTPFPMPPVTGDASLFDRCCEGTVLRCIKDYKVPGTAVTFKSGKRYMVISTGSEGRDVITLGTSPVESKSVLSMVGNGARQEWTPFDSPLDDYFDDSENADIGITLDNKYPKLVEAQRKKLDKLNLKLYEHVKVDMSMASLKRGFINAYPMRMAKSSASIAYAELVGSKKVAIISPGNARIFWEKEFKRLGFKEGQDYVAIRNWSDLESPAKYHLLTYTWLRQEEDKGAKNRKNWDTILKPSKRDTKTGIKALTNECPHCKKPLERIYKNEDGKLVRTTDRGYRCLNKECFYTSDNRKLKGTAWHSKSLVHHKGGYVNYEIAAHLSCPDEHVKHRMCPKCSVSDSVWIPGRYKRLMKKYTLVIADEIHGAKDKTTQTANATYNLRSRRRVGLSGTLISNSPLDAYWPMHYTQGETKERFPFFRTDGEKEFDNAYCDSINLERPAGVETDKDGKEKQLTKIVRKRVPFLKNPPEFWNFMSDKIIRRTYEDPLFKQTLIDNGKVMPKANVNKMLCPMDPHQAALMLSAIKDFKSTFEKMANDADKKNQQLNSTLVISQMTTMRIASTCPEILNSKFKKDTYKGVDGGGKMSYIRNIIDDKVKKEQKILVLSDFHAMHDSVYTNLCKGTNPLLKPSNVIKFSTSWDDEQREENFDKFQLDKDTKVFIAGTRAIREGVDLSAADTVICCDLLWSPAFQTQAWSRIMAPTDRERTCDIYITVSKNSLDEHIFNVFYSKMVAAEQALDRKVASRRAKEIDIRQFVNGILEEELAIQSYMRDSGYGNIFIPSLDLSDFNERYA